MSDKEKMRELFVKILADMKKTQISYLDRQQERFGEVSGFENMVGFLKFRRWEEEFDNILTSLE